MSVVPNVSPGFTNQKEFAEPALAGETIWSAPTCQRFDLRRKSGDRSPHSKNDSLDRELDVAATLRKFLVVLIKGDDLKSIRAFRHRLTHCK
jgi:hypothetical protein